MKILKDYKVLSDRSSATKRYLASNAIVTYPKDEWIELNPGCGPLCVFTDIEDAKLFLLYGVADEKLVPCEYVEAKGITHVWDTCKKYDMLIWARNNNRHIALASKVRSLE